MKKNIRNIILLASTFTTMKAWSDGGISSLSALNPLIYGVYFLAFVITIVIPIVLVIYARKLISKNNLKKNKLIILISPVCILGILGLSSFIPPYNGFTIISIIHSVVFCFLGWSTYKKYTESLKN